MLSGHTMLKCVGQVQNIAPVLYLASNMAGSVTGVTHVVDGGMTID